MDNPMMDYKFNSACDLDRLKSYQPDNPEDSSISYINLCSYEEKLNDQITMLSYKTAIENNSHIFKNKV
jgi:hypothetical protein